MRGRKQNRNCPYCLSPIERHEERVRCPRCGVVHHAECWTTNGKCAIYGCNGWAVWRESVAERVAPETAEKVEVTDEPPESRPKEDPLCIECGRPVKGGQLVCWTCRRAQKGHFFDNCSGPTVLALCAVTGVVTIIVKALM